MKGLQLSYLGHSYYYYLGEYMNIKIYNNKKLRYLELRHIKRDKCKCLNQMNYTLNFLIVIKGSMEIEITNKKYFVKENSILIINPFEMHKCNNILSNNIEYYIIAIDLNWFKSIQKNILNIIFFIPLNEKIIYDTYIYSSLKNICELMINNNSSYLKQHHLLNSCLITIVEQYCIFNNNTTQKIAELTNIEKVFKYIQKNYKNKIIIKEMAKDIKLDHYYMVRLFKKYFNLAPYKFIINYRLYKAKKLLLQKYDISYIAAEIGFYDQSHFHKQFKNNFEITPKQYQNSQIIL